MRKFWRWQKCFISWVWWCLNNDICQNSLNCLVKIDECWYTEGLLWWLSGRESTCQWRRHGFNPWVRKILWRKKWQPTPAFLPGKSHGQRNLADYSPWGHKNQTWLSDQTIATTPTSSLSFMLPRNLRVAWLKVEDRGPEWLAEEVFFSKICLV